MRDAGVAVEDAVFHKRKKERAHLHIYAEPSGTAYARSGKARRRGHSGAVGVADVRFKRYARRPIVRRRR